MELPKLPESSGEKNELIAGLARLAKEVVGGVRANADEKLDEHEKHMVKVTDGLEGIAQAFDTDPEAALSPYEMQAKQVTAVVNFIRSMFGYEPLKEDEKVDLSKDLKTEKDKESVLKIGAKEVTYKNIDFSSIKEVGKRIVQAGLTSVAMKEPVKGQMKQGKLQPACCWDWVKQVYDAAGVKEGPILYQKSTKNHGASIGTLDYDALTDGAWLYIYNGNQYGGEHSVLFSKWIDKDKHIAEVMSYPGAGNENPVQRIHTVDFSKQPITRLSLPKA